MAKEARELGSCHTDVSLFYMLWTSELCYELHHLLGSEEAKLPRRRKLPARLSGSGEQHVHVTVQDQLRTVFYEVSTALYNTCIQYVFTNPWCLCYGLAGNRYRSSCNPGKVPARRYSGAYKCSNPPHDSHSRWHQWSCYSRTSWECQQFLQLWPVEGEPALSTDITPHPGKPAGAV